MKKYTNEEIYEYVIEYTESKIKEAHIEGYKKGYEEGYKAGLETAEKVYPVSVADADLLRKYNKISTKEYTDFIKAKAEIVKAVSERYSKIQQEKNKVFEIKRV